MPFSEYPSNHRHDADDIFAADQSEAVELAINRLGDLDSEICGDLLSALSEALITIHGLSAPLNDSQFLRLSSAVYRGLGSAIANLSHRIPVGRLRDGLLSAAVIVANLHAGDTSNDRYLDAISRSNVLKAYTEICRFEDEIASRKHDRQRATVAGLLPETNEDVFS